jgi:dihydrofolate synthase/folylpolyglutamate synthase
VIVETARRLACPLVELGREFTFEYRPPRHLDQTPSLAGMDFDYRSGNATRRFDDLRLALVGRHQTANAAVGLAALAELEPHGFEIPESAVRRGLAQVRWPARAEVLGRRPAIVVDSAHNVASAEALVQLVDESFASPRRLLVFATTRDKDARGMLAVLLPRFDEVIFTRYWSNPRGVPPEELDALAAGVSPIPRHTCPDPATAWQLTRKLATRDHLIVVAGSIFLAAEMRAATSRP